MKKLSMLAAAAGMATAFAFGEATPDAFPAPTAETKPWGVCHLLGNAVDLAEFEKEAGRWADAGFGGMRFVPLYGVKGNEANNVEFMSPQFVELFRGMKCIMSAHGLGTDLSFGAGWCFGGRTVPPELGTQTLKVVKPGKTSPPGSKTLFERGGTRLVAAPTGKKGRVKRTQALDAGPMINPFSPEAMAAHLALFKGFDGAKDALPRAGFHDSYEYYGAFWADGLPALFRKYRGYSIKNHYAELAGLGDPETVARVKCDYRETLSDAIVKETFPLWTRWCRERGVLTHNQAHGAPADLLAFYAISDVPETEMFGRGKRDPFKSGFGENFREGSRSVLFSKFASSAAHIAGKRHASAEAFTWLAENFCETIEETKAFGDLLFLAGIDRLYWHATIYSPDCAPWPGWCFYAASQFNPRNPVWRDVKPLNAYFTRVQSLLADAKPDNDVLLFWPLHDLWTDPSGFAHGLGVNDKWMRETAFGRLAQRLADAGYAFDYVSDPFLGDDVVSRYKAIVVPEAKHMKPETFARLKSLAAKMPVIFEKSHPSTAPGLAATPLDATGAPAPVADAVKALAATEAVRDKFASKNTPFDGVRLAWKGGRLYFIVNSSTDDATLSVPDGAVVMDPMEGTVETVAASGRRTHSRRRLAPAESCFVWTKKDRIGHTRNAEQKPQKTIALNGKWTLEFTRDVSGWKLPPRREGNVLGDWTAFGEAEAEFSGEAKYTTHFTLSAAEAEAGGAMLDLGEACHSARVRINGKDAGAAFMHPYRVKIAAGILREGENEIEISVANLGANRIRAYDRKGVEWKKFEEINVADIRYKRLDASRWPVLKSGLIGPVALRLPAPPHVSGRASRHRREGRRR